MTSIRPNVSGRERNTRRSTPSVQRSELPKSKSTPCSIEYEYLSELCCAVLYKT